MGQLFNRLKNFARVSLDVQSDARWAERMLNEDDEELRRIIEELSNESAGGQTASSSQTEPPPADKRQHVPQDVLQAHTLLNVPVNASRGDIKKAYRNAITRWHPDRFVQASADEQLQAQHQARAINSAYVRLKDFYQFR